MSNSFVTNDDVLNFIIMYLLNPNYFGRFLTGHTPCGNKSFSITVLFRYTHSTLMTRQFSECTRDKWS